MKLAFICGRLSGGGVTDYTLLLARELVKMGHECICVSFNEQSAFEEVAIAGGTMIRANRESAPEAMNHILKWNPDWISLQFVSFAFQDKGLVNYLIPLLLETRLSSRLEVMFHELWVRPGKGAPLKHVLLGYFQKHIIQRAIKAWNPELIHTSNELYLQILESAGIEAEVIPLFGNIPIAEVKSESRLSSAKQNLRRIIMPFSQSRDWDAAKAMAQLEKCARLADVELEIIQAGHDRDGEHHWKTIEQFALNTGWTCRRLGKLDAAELSRLMQEADLGLNSIYKEMAGRSGAVVSMREHGLAVLCAGPVDAESEYTLHDADEPIMSIFADESAVISRLKAPLKSPPKSKLPEVSQAFIEALNQFS